MHKYAVIVAGGTGQRMGADMPKQFLELAGAPILVHSVRAFLEAFDDIQIILVMHRDHLGLADEMIRKYFPDLQYKMAAGGETRFHSVKNGLGFVGHSSLVCVHDAVRCLSTPALIRRVFNQAMEKGSAIPVVPVRDSIRTVDGDHSVYLDRERLRVVQTPQAFQSELLLAAFDQEFQPSFTDEASVVEHLGTRTFMMEGEESNIKITVPSDLLLAEQILAHRVNPT